MCPSPTQANTSAEAGSESPVPPVVAIAAHARAQGKGQLVRLSIPLAGTWKLSGVFLFSWDIA